MTATGGVASCPDVSVISYQVRRVRGKDEMREALALRHAVFCREQGVPEFEELDGRDSEGIHLAAIADGDLVGTCRLLHVGHTVQFSRLAVRADARRQGIATRLLELADSESRAMGAKRLVLHAQTYARELYERVGYRPRGKAFIEAGIEHVAMEKVL
jgi:predicted GNAT family N-acyltransferase